jgi:hypothetical protein
VAKEQDGRMDAAGIAIATPVQQECTLLLVLAVFLLQVTLSCHFLATKRLRPTVNTAANALRSRVLLFD